MNEITLIKFQPWMHLKTMLVDHLKWQVCNIQGHKKSKLIKLNKKYECPILNTCYCIKLLFAGLHVGGKSCEKRHSFRQYNSERKAGWRISKWRGVECEGHRLDMTDNTQNTKQCNREVDLTSLGIMTLPSQLGMAPIPHTFFFFISTTGESSADWAADSSSTISYHRRKHTFDSNFLLLNVIKATFSASVKYCATSFPSFSTQE